MYPYLLYLLTGTEQPKVGDDVDVYRLVIVKDLAKSACTFAKKKQYGPTPNYTTRRKLERNITSARSFYPSIPVTALSKVAPHGAHRTPLRLEQLKMNNKRPTYPSTNHESPLLELLYPIIGHADGWGIAGVTIAPIAEPGAISAPPVSPVDVVIREATRLVFGTTSIENAVLERGSFPRFGQDMPPAPLVLAVLGFFPDECPRTRCSTSSTTSSTRCAPTSSSSSSSCSPRLQTFGRETPIDRCHRTLGGWFCVVVVCGGFSAEKLLSLTYASKPRSRKKNKFSSPPLPL